MTAQKEAWVVLYEEGKAFPVEKGVSLMGQVISWQECVEIARQDQHQAELEPNQKTRIILAKKAIDAHYLYVKPILQDL